MRESLKSGLSLTGRKSLIVILLFMYEMLWGFLLYRYVKSVAVPLLYRYPSDGATDWAALFWIEGEFRLLKTDLADGYLLTLLAILVARMALTPLINAGLFYAVHHASHDQWRSFFRGIRMRWGRFSILYIVQMSLTALPLYWLVPSFIQHVYNGTLSDILWPNYALIAAGFILYIALIRLSFMYMQFAATADKAWGGGLVAWLRSLLPAFGLSTCIVLILIGIQGILTVSSLWWAGLAALILYQAGPLVRVICQVWEIAAQHELWRKNEGLSNL